MKSVMGSLLILTALMLNACSKDGGGSGGNVGPMDVTRYNIEGVSEETTLTDSDFKSRLDAMKVKPRACRQSAFGTLRKGDRFVLNKRGSSNVDGTARNSDITTNMTVTMIKDREASFVGTVENVTAMGMTQSQIIKSNRATMRCRIGRDCTPDLDYVSRDVKRLFDTYSAKNTVCTFKNYRNATGKYGMANYALQDGRKIQGLTERVQALVDMDCTGQATQAANLSMVTVYSNQAKSFKGEDCTDGATRVYSYILVQSEASRGTLMELNSRLLLAPAK